MYAIRSYYAIFLVDDDPKILAAVETILRMAGFDNITAIQDSRDVIRTMERRIPGLVLLDLNMPHINGDHLLKSIRKTWPRIPVIVLTGDVEVDTAVKCMKIGAMDYILKPVDPDRLVKSVKQSLDCGQAPGQFSPPVITSYSIHYTKLYAPADDLHRLNAGRQGDGHNHLFGHHIEHITQFRCKDPGQIRSGFGKIGIAVAFLGQLGHEIFIVVRAHANRGDRDVFLEQSYNFV